MQGNPGPWGDELDAAWETFRVDLVGRLDTLAVGDVLALEPGQGAGTPYVRFAVLEGKGVLAEVCVKAATETSGVALLGARGWCRPADASSPDATYWRAEPPGYDDLALVTERALREVFGLLHPAFLAPLEVSCQGADEQMMFLPRSREELMVRVDEALLPLLGDGLGKDGDGDVIVVTGDTMVHVQVVADAPAIDVFSVLVSGVTDLGRALVEVNILNRTPGGATYVCRGERIVARQRIAAQPFVAQQLRDVVASALASYDELAGDLVGRVGGRRTLTEPEEAEHPHETAATVPSGVPARICLRTLMHLEADQPGSVDARLAAHIFQHDQQAILGQITWLRRDGRVSLVPLLRQALRVVVETDAHQRSRG